VRKGILLSTIMLSLVLYGCAVPRVTMPQTEAAQQSGPAYGYRPLDPLSAKLQHQPRTPVTNCRILELFPDETVRLAIGQFDTSGNLSYGVAKAGYVGNRYSVVLDYIKSDTLSLPAIDSVTTARQVPIYVGIGLRLTANLIVNSGSVDLANLIAIGAAAQAKQLSGTLVIQTLGISGESISSAIPIPSEISESSIQNALVAIGTIKSKIYDDKISISPRVIGIYDIFGTDTKAFDTFFASLLNAPPSVYERENSSQCPTVVTPATATAAPTPNAPATASGSSTSSGAVKPAATTTATPTSTTGDTKPDTSTKKASSLNAHSKTGAAGPKKEQGSTEQPSH